MRNTIRSLAAAGVIGTAATGAGAQQGQAVQWRTEDGGNGHWYQLFRESTYVCWNDAKQIAESLGGHLATIHSAGEDAFAKAIPQGLSGVPTAEFGPWLGLTCAGRAWGDWYWVTGEPFTYQAWPGWAPNPGANEEYLHYWRYGNLNWNDAGQCLVSTGRSYLVEWSADCNGDGIVDYGQCHDGSLPDYNSNLVPDCCESGEPCVAGNYPVQWRESDGGNGHWYMAVRPFGTVTDWEMARAYAAARGGYLMTVTSAAEQSLIERLFTGSTSCQDDLSGVFLGGRQPTGNAAGANWGWITGEPWDYTNWASSEPNDFAGFAEDYLMMVTQDMRWYDIVLGGAYLPCAYSAVVEWSADCDSDGVLDKGQILRGQLLDVDGNGVPDVCECRADVTENGAVDGIDLAAVLGAWGTNGQGQYITDIDGDGVVGGADLAFVLGGWGTCE